MRVPWFKCPSRSPLAKCKGQVQPDPLRSQTQTPTKCAGDAIPQKLVTSYGQRHWLTSIIVSCTISVPYTEVIEQAGPLCPMVAKHTQNTLPLFQVGTCSAQNSASQAAAGHSGRLALRLCFAARLLRRIAFVTWRSLWSRWQGLVSFLPGALVQRLFQLSCQQLVAMLSCQDIHAP